MIEPITNEEFYCLVAPDGVLQLPTLAPDLSTSMAFTKLLHKAGMSKSLHQLKMQDYTYQKVFVTIVSDEKIEAEKSVCSCVEANGEEIGWIQKRHCNRCDKVIE